MCIYFVRARETPLSVLESTRHAIVFMNFALRQFCSPVIGMAMMFADLSMQFGIVSICTKQGSVITLWSDDKTSGLSEFA